MVIYVRMIAEMLVIAIFIYFVSGRLMGSKVNFTKRILSVVLGIVLTTFVYWYSYLRYTEFMDDAFATMLTDTSTVIWIGSMLMISMLFYLILELFDPIELGDRGERITNRKFIWKRLRSRWRRQKRLSKVLEIAVKNGISSTLKYARHRENNYELAVAFRRTLEEAGGVFVKFGQVLSTRTDLFAPVFIEELSQLQQNVKALPKEQVTEILRKSMTQPIEEVFSKLEKEPLASASIGQIHRGVLRKTNEEVIIKMQRPEVSAIMRDDLDILLEFAEWVSSKSSWAQNIGFRELAVGFANGLREEIDFEIEMRNMIQVSNALEDSKNHVKIPKVYREYSNSTIIVMQYFQGKSISQGDAVFRHFTVEPKNFGRTVLFSFLEQMLFSGIFHADPHPGNIFIDETDGKPILLDFGSVGRLTAPQQEALNHFIIGIQQNDASIVHDAVRKLVENSEKIDGAKFEQAIGEILLKISYVDRIPTAELIHSLFDVIREFGLAFYPSVGIALRSLISLDSTLHTIDPNFDMFTEAKSFAKEYKTSVLKKPFKQPLATKERIEEELVLILPEVAKLPKRIDQLIRRVEGGKIILHHDVFSDKHNSGFVMQLFSRFVLLMSGITFGFISAALLAIAQFIDTVYAIYLNTAAYGGLFLCVILLVRLSIQAIRDMKRSNQYK